MVVVNLMRMTYVKVLLAPTIFSHIEQHPSFPVRVRFQSLLSLHPQLFVSYSWSLAVVSVRVAHYQVVIIITIAV